MQSILTVKAASWEAPHRGHGHRKVGGAGSLKGHMQSQKKCRGGALMLQQTNTGHLQALQAQQTPRRIIPLPHSAAQPKLALRPRLQRPGQQR